MSDTSSRLNMPLIAPSQAQKHVTHNEALILLDALVQTGVVASDLPAPPTAVPDNAIYIVGSNPTDDWSGQAGNLAFQQTGAWRFLSPQEGWRVWDASTETLLVFSNGAWGPLPAWVDQLDGLGINAAWDTTNRLTVDSDATLLTSSDGSHRLTVNKNDASDTASLLFQSGYFGHAEMGLVGDTALAIKVSADGSSWSNAFAIDPTTVTVSGDVIQQTSDDTTPGRLMRADWGYSPGNVVGPVEQAGGVPTGAVIERGSNANGEYVRFADGTQMCWKTLTLTYNSNHRLIGDWAFPAAFSESPALGANLRDEFVNGTAPPDETEILGPWARQGNTPSYTDCSVRLYRIKGGANFNADNEATVYVKAIGRWF